MSKSRGELIVRNRSAQRAGQEGNWVYPIASALGLQSIQDFFLYSVLAGLAYQVRAGTITTPLVGDVVLTDAAAEYCVDATNGYTIVPVTNIISVRLGGGTLHEYAVKSVNAVSTGGTAFVPLPLRNLGPDGASAAAASTSARVSAAGGVTVTAELATTTRRHWSWANPVAVGAGNELASLLPWEPRMPPILSGPVCLYVQIAATTTGPSYYAALDYIELVTAQFL